MATYLLPTAKAWCWALAETCPQPLRHHVTWVFSSWTDVIWHTQPWICKCAAIFHHQVQMACMRGTWADAGFTENSHWLLVYLIFHRSTMWTFSEVLENCSSFWVWFLRNHFHFSESFSITQQVKDSPAMQETWVQSLGWEDPLEMGTPTHSSILDWRIPWTEEADRLQSMGSQRVWTLWATFTFIQYLLYLPTTAPWTLAAFSLSFFPSFFFFFSYSWAFWYSANQNSYGKMLFFSSQNYFIHSSFVTESRLLKTDHCITW